MKKILKVFLSVLTLLIQSNLLYAAGPEQDELMDAISKADLTRVRRIFDDPTKKSKLKLDERETDGDERGWNALSLASALGNVPVVELLLEQGASLGEGYKVDEKNVTPLILATQYGHRDVLETILYSPRFKSEDYKREIRVARSFGQPDLVSHLIHASGISPDAASLSAQANRANPGSDDKEVCESASGSFPGDQIAQNLQNIYGECSVCLQIPGHAGKTKLINGSYHTGDSVLTECGHCFCKECLDQAIVARSTCPDCRSHVTQQTYQVTKNKVPELKWSGDKVPLPGQSPSVIAHAGVSVQNAGLLGNFIRLQGGTFQMGSEAEGKQWVRLNPFEIQETRFTQDQWIELTGQNPSRIYENGGYRPYKRSDCPGDFDERNGHPLCKGYAVTYISYNDIMAMLPRLNEQEGASGFNYDLPTEAQGEFASRAGANTAYPFGDTAEGNPDSTQTLAYYAWYSKNNPTHKPQKLKQKNPIANGLFDTMGNGWEWRKDVYASYPEGSTESAPFVDPQGPLASAASSRVLRGGSGNAADCRSAYRNSGNPGGRYGSYVLRLVRTSLVP